jgi:transposase InsO family protein
VADATRIVRTCEGCQFYARQTHLPAQALQTIPITWPFVVWGLDLVGPLQKAPGGYTHLLVAIDKFSKWIKVRPLNSIRSEQAVAFFTNIIHRFGVPNSIITDNGTQFTGRKFLDFCEDHHISGGLGRRGSPHDEWASRACQRHDSTRTQASDLQRPQQVRKAVDEGTPLGGLESEDDAKPGHGLHTVLSSLWGRGRLAHRLRIRFPEDEGLRRPKQSS